MNRPQFSLVKKIVVCLLLFVCNKTYPQDSNCQNLGFELGNFTNWVGHSWRHSIDATWINSEKVEGIVYRRHTIMRDTFAYDVNTGGELKIVPKGYRFCARLGDAITSSDTNPRCWNQSLRYTMTIDSSNALLIMKFACVLQYANDHSTTMEPRFKLTLFDQNGDTIPDCANYDVYSSNTTVAGFHTYQPPESEDPVQWRDWTTVGANLLSYMGQTITVEFMAADCTGRYHYGYAYFIAKCHPMSIAVKYCAGDSVAQLIAPEGFESYEWKDSRGIKCGTSDTLEVADPTEGAVYSCTMTSATGCTATLDATIVRYEITADFSSYMLDCFSNKVQFRNETTTTNGYLTYNWLFDDSTTSTNTHPQHTFATSGIHRTTLEISNPPSECTYTLIKDVESFSPPLVGIGGDSTYCPNELVTLSAYGAYQYVWCTGSTDVSIDVGAPGGKYWMVGESSTGCVSDTSYITISEEADWDFGLTGDASFCESDTIILTASGAESYSWSTGSLDSFIAVTETRTYTVIGANARGCIKQRSQYVQEHPLPLTSFNVSSTTIDERHNQLTCSLTPENGAAYEWDMGDGDTELGTSVQHTYSVSNTILGYDVVLTATSQYGCTDSSSITIDVIPFIPNVFSPNGDGINDFFAVGHNLKVFDRNGVVFYEGREGWDGTFNGRYADPDTYFYLIYYTDKKGLQQVLKGYITLVR